MENQNQRVTEILESTGLDFRISKRPMAIVLEDGTTKPTQYYGLVNSKTGDCIHTVKKGYTVSQNDEIVNLIVEGTKSFADTLSITKGGSLNGGRKVYLQLAVEGAGKVGNDTIKRFITVIDSNDGSTGLSVGIGDITLSCTNQFWKFYKRGEAKFRHTATIEQKLQELPMLIETALNKSMKQIDLYNRFASTAISRDMAHEAVFNILGVDRTMKDKVAEMATRGLNNMNALYANIYHELDEKGLNLWGLHSGVTRYTTHDMSKPKRENGFEESVMIGGAYKANQKSLDMVTRKLGILEMA